MSSRSTAMPAVLAGVAGPSPPWASGARRVSWSSRASPTSANKPSFDIAALIAQRSHTPRSHPRSVRPARGAPVAGFAGDSSLRVAAWGNLDVTAWAQTPEPLQPQTAGDFPTLDRTSIGRPFSDVFSDVRHRRVPRLNFEPIEPQSHPLVHPPIHGKQSSLSSPATPASAPAALALTEFGDPSSARIPGFGVQPKSGADARNGQPLLRESQSRQQHISSPNANPIENVSSISRLASFKVGNVLSGLRTSETQTKESKTYAAHRMKQQRAKWKAAHVSKVSNSRSGFTYQCQKPRCEFGCNQGKPCSLHPMLSLLSLHTSAAIS
jgi:hypothetical protein